jgi:hypothetical protein
MSKSLRRTPRTPRVSPFARLGLGAFYGAIGSATFYEFILVDNFEKNRIYLIQRPLNVNGHPAFCQSNRTSLTKVARLYHRAGAARGWVATGPAVKGR